MNGIVAAGHPVTAAAGQRILAEGGNAFDAAVAAFFAACVAEPVLASLGGGGFLLAGPAGDSPRVFDFFVQTPRERRKLGDIDLQPVIADFGSATQEFHIGRGSIATPGCVRGMFEIQRRLCSMPMRVLVEPAIEAARDGVEINAFQSYIASVIAPILRHSDALRALYRGASGDDALFVTGEIQRQPELADVLEHLSAEGDRFFYEGEPAAWVEAQYEAGGQLTRQDLRDYRVSIREPLAFGYRDARIFTNPPPSTGGVLIRFLLKMMEQVRFSEAGFGSQSHLLGLVQAMELTGRARTDVARRLAERGEGDRLALLEREEILADYMRAMRSKNSVSRGTTHISILDRAGNVASLSSSNGEGCGYPVPGTGIMLNNMLGEQDLNHGGFQRWEPDTRMGSMMAPTLVYWRNERHVALGSGGSNRIRSAIAQVLINLLDFGCGLKTAIANPRLHYELDTLFMEPGFPDEGTRALEKTYARCHRWDANNLYFGGVHAVECRGGRLTGVGDARRGGVP